MKTKSLRTRIYNPFKIEITGKLFNQFQMEWPKSNEQLTHFVEVIQSDSKLETHILISYYQIPMCDDFLKIEPEEFDSNWEIYSKTIINGIKDTEIHKRLTQAGGTIKEEKKWMRKLDLPVEEGGETHGAFQVTYTIPYKKLYRYKCKMEWKTQVYSRRFKEKVEGIAAKYGSDFTMEDTWVNFIEECFYDTTMGVELMVEYVIKVSGDISQHSTDREFILSIIKNEINLSKMHQQLLEDGAYLRKDKNPFRYLPCWNLKGQESWATQKVNYFLPF